MSGYLTGQSFDVEIDFDKPRTLKIDFNALCRAEEKTGLNFLDWNEELTGVRLRALVWASLQYEEGEHRLTLHECGEILNARIIETTIAITEGWLKSMPTAEELTEEEGQVDPQQPATAPS